MALGISSLTTAECSGLVGFVQNLFAVVARSSQATAVAWGGMGLERSKSSVLSNKFAECIAVDSKITRKIFSYFLNPFIGRRRTP
jgi:hypothetical protein